VATFARSTIVGSYSKQTCTHGHAVPLANHNSGNYFKYISIKDNVCGIEHYYKT